MLPSAETFHTKRLWYDRRKQEVNGHHIAIFLLKYITFSVFASLLYRTQSVFILKTCSVRMCVI